MNIKYKVSAFVLFVLIAIPQLSIAVVSCADVSVSDVQSAVSPTFHNFNELGIVGATFFIQVDSAKCVDNAASPFSNYVFMVVDDIGNASFLKKSWISLLLTAKSTGKTIDFHASNLGKNSIGFQVITPYYIRLK